jgi:phage regulator Rha-like protein
MPNESHVPAEYVDRAILEVRGTKVILDADLAELFGVATKVLNQAVRRNAKRFPAEFMFQLTSPEFTDLRSQSVTSSWGGRRYPPFAFTEHGAIMAANVLSSERAIEMSVFIVRAFVRLRSIFASHIGPTVRLDELEAKIGEHDEAIRSIVATLHRLMTPPASDRHPIGFTPENEPPEMQRAPRDA